MGLPKVAFIGTGGTIASVGKTPLDLQDYGASGVMLHADEIVGRVPELQMVADVMPVRFANVPSTAIYRGAERREPVSGAERRGPPVGPVPGRPGQGLDGVAASEKACSVNRAFIASTLWWKGTRR